MYLETLNMIAALPAAPDPGGGGGAVEWVTNFFNDLAGMFKAGTFTAIALGLLIALFTIKGVGGRLAALGVAALIAWGVNNYQSNDVQDKIDNEVSAPAVVVSPPWSV